MLTPDQMRLRLDRITYHETDRASAELVALLREVLPDLIALANGRSTTYTDADVGRRYVHGLHGDGNDA